MIGQLISHYKILEKLGEVPIRLNLASEVKLSSSVGLSIPLNESTDSSSRRPSLGGSGKEAVL